MPAAALTLARCLRSHDRTYISLRATCALCPPLHLPQRRVPSYNHRLRISSVCSKMIIEKEKEDAYPDEKETQQQVSHANTAYTGILLNIITPSLAPPQNVTSPLHMPNGADLQVPHNLQLSRLSNIPCSDPPHNNM